LEWVGLYIKNIITLLYEEQVNKNHAYDFCILVPTKALINEVSHETICELDFRLKEFNYQVVTSAGAMALERKERPNLILVLTPERLLYLLIRYPDINIQYLFVDEAHKISSKDSRSAFYYKDIDLLSQQKIKPHIAFASPNIPNPKVYLNLIPDAELIDIDARQLPTKFSPVSQIKYLLDLTGGEINIFNSYTSKLIPFGRINKATSFTDIVRRLESSKMTAKDSQTIVYFNSKEKAVEYARAYANAPDKKSKNDPELDALAKDIRNQISPAYYLAEIIPKGVAYHIGYLPSSIRMKIEDLYRKGKIDILFCTSTLIEGVNLPADNLFITTSWRGGSKLKEVDFRNLIGRVGRIKYNLYGNVFLILGLDERTNAKDYVDLLQKPVPDQELSLVSALSDEQKKQIIDCLVRGDVEFKEIAKPKSYELMRKFALILLRDILKNRNSTVRNAFESFLTLEYIEKIKAHFNTKDNKPDDDINTSVDQTQGIYAKIRNGLHYPILGDDETENYNKLVAFLLELHSAFKWSQYEKGGILEHTEPLTRLAVLLKRWVGGGGLGLIISESINYFEVKPDKFYINHKHEHYDRSPKHKNHIISETLELIEHTLLFSLSNYFLRFSDAYKKINNIKGVLQNDWYEYIEYGSMNPLTILLQRNSFSRDTALYIKDHKNEYVVYSESGAPFLSKALLRCDNDAVVREVYDAILNIPELFVG
jgi:superfamily II DNA/RNA helicase